MIGGIAVCILNLGLGEVNYQLHIWGERLGSCLGPGVALHVVEKRIMPDCAPNPI